MAGDTDPGGHDAARIQVPAFLLALFFVYAIFFTPLVAEQMKALTKDSRFLRYVLVAVCGAFVIAVVPRTDWNPDQGRLSGFWNLVKIAPAIDHRSILLAVLCPLGAALLTAWLFLATERMRWILGASIAAFTAAQTANHFAYERYYAGFLFIVLVLLLWDIRGRDMAASNDPQWTFAPLLVLAALNLFVLVRGLT